MLRRNNTTKIDPTPVIDFKYPRSRRDHAMVREAQQMRAHAMRDSVSEAVGLRDPPPFKRTSLGQSEALKA